jgi:CheY-like chemotaxis protein
MAQILIAEDESITAMALVDALESQGHEVRDAADGAAALEIMASFEPDVLVTDINMPGMDGFELLRRLHARPGGAPPVILITALPQSTLPKDLDYQAYLGKPVDQRRLYSLIDQLSAKVG